MKKGIERKRWEVSETASGRMNDRFILRKGSECYYRVGSLH